jgi:hypothetical protein
MGQGYGCQGKSFIINRLRQLRNHKSGVFAVICITYPSDGLKRNENLIPVPRKPRSHTGKGRNTGPREPSPEIVELME